MLYGVRAVFIALILMAAGFAQPERPLTNNDVIQLVKAGLSQSLILSQIRNSRTSFDLSTPEVIRLAKEGVPESIIEAMRAPAPSAGSVVPDRPGAGAPPAASVAKSVKLRDGEKVRLILMEDISSSTAHSGDRLNFTVAEEVKVGDAVVIAKGATAWGAIDEAQKKQFLGRGGRLTMRMEYVKAVNSQNVRIRATAGREGDDKLGKTVVVALLAGPFALLVKGKDVAMPKGTEYAAYIDEDKEILLEH